ncbi:hypothetical protein Mag101_12420 [Microbulbifer agarilyticus]|uniref:Uncharacterized protein n=2 Tax=Microbulbifer agarilyticus TaxID=260552 RepID=A0A1Q2M6R8_9GAMM|nr:hypothetical protein Mag101_12420 [Microbulbifer agarilyticus]
MLLMCVLMGYLCVDTWKMSMLEITDNNLLSISKKAEYVHCRDGLAKRKLELSGRHWVSTSAIPHDEPCTAYAEFLERNDFEITYKVYDQHVVSIESKTEVFMSFTDWISYMNWFRYIMAFMFLVLLLGFFVQIGRRFNNSKQADALSRASV